MVKLHCYLLKIGIWVLRIKLHCYLLKITIGVYNQGNYTAMLSTKDSNNELIIASLKSDF